MLLVERITAVVKAIAADMAELRIAVESLVLGSASFPETFTDPAAPKAGEVWVKLTAEKASGLFHGTLGAMPLLEDGAPAKSQVIVQTTYGPIELKQVDKSEVVGIPEIVGADHATADQWVRTEPEQLGGVLGGFYAGIPILSEHIPELSVLKVRTTNGRIFQTSIQ